MLDYGEVEEPWHERLLLLNVAGNDWVVLTPDMDVYVEEIAVPPLGGVRHVAADGALPFGLGSAYGQPTYRFVKFPTAAAFLLIEAEAEQIARLAIASDAGRYAVALAVPPLPAAAPPGLRIPAAAAAPVQARWIAISNAAGIQAGDEIELTTVQLHGTVLDNLAIIVEPGRGSYAAYNVSSGPMPFNAGRLQEAWDPAATPRGPPDAGPLEDARTLPIIRNGSGERYRHVKSAVDSSAEVAFPDFPFDGPRTAFWLAKEISKTGLDPLARHYQWRHENSIKDDERAGDKHELLSELFELAMTYDQLDISNLAMTEAVSRHMQHVEFEVKKKVEAKKGVDSSEYYLGRSRKPGGNLLNPALQKHIAERASRDSAILKEQRKAAEERELLKKAK